MPPRAMRRQVPALYYFLKPLRLGLAGRIRPEFPMANEMTMAEPRPLRAFGQGDLVKALAAALAVLAIAAASGFGRSPAMRRQ